MRAVDLIVKKREGKALNPDELDFLIQGFVRGEIPDYQMSAFCMAVYFKNMIEDEIIKCTELMAKSGDMLDLSSIDGIKADKHSTGGIGDTTTLILAPLLASSGIKVAKMSGRALGYTGGTIDKLESIPGMQTNIGKDSFLRQVREIGIAVAAQSENMVPADKKLYTLRDVTGTIESIPLIASSIMSKKIACGSEIIALDVKVGSGAFMKTIETAKELSQIMVQIGNKMHRKIIAVVSDMNQPLGMSIGNSLEVSEAIQVLRGEKKGRLLELVNILGTQILLAADKAKTIEEASQILRDNLEKKQALRKMAEMIKAQNGDERVLEDLSLLPQAKYKMSIRAEKDGHFIISDTELLGKIAMLLGAGREHKNSQIDLSVGIKIMTENISWVKEGEIIIEIHYNDEKKLKNVLPEIKKAYYISENKISQNPLIYGIYS